MKLLSRNDAAVSLTAIGDCVTVSSYDTVATAVAIKAIEGTKTIGFKVVLGIIWSFQATVATAVGIKLLRSREANGSTNVWPFRATVATAVATKYILE